MYYFSRERWVKVMKLSDAVVDNTYTISSLKCGNSAEISHFSSLGFYPGAKIKILQNSPFKIYALGGSRIALSENMAAMINVKQ